MLVLCAATGCGSGGTSAVQAAAGVAAAGASSGGASTFGGASAGSEARGGAGGLAGEAGQGGAGFAGGLGADEGGEAGASAATAGSTAAGATGAAGAAGQGAAGAAGTSWSGSGGATAGTAGGDARLACSRAADCPDDQVCGEPTADGSFYCVDPEPTGGELGAACAQSYFTTECQDRLCLTGFSDQCTRVCVDDTDCADVDGFGCADMVDARYCVQLCDADADCQGGQVCSILSNAALDRYDWLCSLPRGTVPAGDPPGGGSCEGTSNDDCENAFCLTQTRDGTTSYHCTRPCVTGADCPASLPECIAVNMATPDSGTPQAMQLCGLP
jgi:hypothetical protein